MKSSLLFFVSAMLILAIALRLWMRKEEITTPAPPGSSLAVVIDNSASQRIDCGEIAEMVRNGLGAIQVGKGSRLTLYTLGSQETAFEPVPRLDIGVERGAGGIRKAARKTEKACGDIQTISGSSIFRAVQVVLDQMQSKGGKGGRLFVRTDLEENVDARLFKNKGKTALLHNDGIQTVFCGIADTAEGGGPRGEQADALQKVWRGAFVRPQLVEMQPFCPGAVHQASR